MSFTTFETSDPPTKQLALPERKKMLLSLRKKKLSAGRLFIERFFTGSINGNVVENTRCSRMSVCLIIQKVA